MARYDILPSKDMQTVKKDLKDIKKKLSKKKTTVKRKQAFKVLPHSDVVVVKKDIKQIKKTFDKKVLRDKPKTRVVKATRFDNYYDMLPHKKVRELEYQLVTLRDKLRKKQDREAAKRSKPTLSSATKQVMASMAKLNTSITRLIRIFEDADELMRTSDSAPISISAPSGKVDLAPLVNEMVEIKARLGELSAENEEMAKGILVIAEMLKESPPDKKSEEPEAPSIGVNPPPADQKKDDIPPLGSPFEPFYHQPGPAIPPTKETADKRRFDQL